MKKQQHNKGIPKLRFREFREDRGWGLKALNDLGEIVTGKTPSTKEKELWDGNILFITPTDLNDNNKYQEKAERTILKTDNIRILPVGSIAYTCIASIGKIAITSKPSITNQQINSIIVNRKFNSEFIYYSLIHLTPYIKTIPATSTLPIINKSEFSRIQVLIPTVREQQKIAACLSSLDDVIELESEKLTALRAHKKGLLQKLFPAEGKKAPELRFQEFRKEGEWEEKKLGEIAKFLKGKGISKLDISENGRTPCIRYGELYTYYKEKIDSVISFTNLPIKDLVLSLKNDVIIPSSGETKEDIATAACILKEGIALGGDLNIIRSEMDGAFLSYYLNHALKWEIAKIAQGYSVVHLYSSQLQNLKIKIPNKLEQQKIASCLSSIDELIESQSKKTEQLEQHKKGLMQQLFPEEE